ncbi:unnamed protein product, partial [Prorocentrum cordatum]
PWPRGRGGTARRARPRGAGRHGLLLRGAGGAGLLELHTRVGAWVDARVLDVLEDATVRVQYGMSQKVVRPEFHAALLRQRSEASSPSRPARYLLGQAVEVFSKSGNRWVPARVREVLADGALHVQYADAQHLFKVVPPHLQAGALRAAGGAPAAAPEDGWPCQLCTFQNPEREGSCQVCLAPRGLEPGGGGGGGAEAEGAPRFEPPPGPDDAWACPRCSAKTPGAARSARSATPARRPRASRPPCTPRSGPGAAGRWPPPRARRATARRRARESWTARRRRRSSSWRGPPPIATSPLGRPPAARPLRAARGRPAAAGATQPGRGPHARGRGRPGQAQWRRARWTSWRCPPPCAPLWAWSRWRPPRARAPAPAPPRRRSGCPARSATGCGRTRRRARRGCGTSTTRARGACWPTRWGSGRRCRPAPSCRRPGRPGRGTPWCSCP